MGFKCEGCGQAQKAGTRPARIVTETRRREYTSRKYKGRGRVNIGGKKFEFFEKDPGGQGSEIVREIAVCPACAAQWRGLGDDLIREADPFHAAA